MAEEDLIFGKNRHFYGGIEPSNMTKFEVTVESNIVTINAQLPGDTIVNGQTLCSIAGAVIRRKDSGYPVDEFDGDKVADITESGSFVDPNADPTKMYYYAAFPYSTQGVYNISSINRAIVNEPTPPNPMVAFTAKSVYNSATDTASVQLTVDMPDDAVGVVIRKSTSMYPINEASGDEVMTVTEDGVYTDNNVIVGMTYYYSAFPYSSSGGYNREETNRVSVIPKKRQFLYGYDLDTTDSNPTTRVTYPEDVENVNFTAAYMDFASNTFNYGSWPSTPGEMFMPRPCMLTYAGVVDHYLDPNDYTKKEDDSASSVTDTAFDGNAMMEWPKIYTKRWEDGNGIYHFRCSDIKVDDDYECWCNYDKNNNEIDHFYTPIYFGSLSSSKIRSISGQVNSVSTNVNNEITYATANGDDWYIEVLADRLLIQDLLVMMAKTTDCQTAYGYGVCNGNANTLKTTGTLDTKGLFWGSNDKISGVKVFGMENLWGNIYRRVAGWINNARTHTIKITRGTRDGSTATDYNMDGTGYLSITESLITADSNGYINDMHATAYGRLPVTAKGSSTTYEPDGMLGANYGVRYAAVGGAWGDGLSAGPFRVSLSNYTTTASTDIGAALSCKPSAN